MILKEYLLYVNIFGIMNIVAHKGSLKSFVGLIPIKRETKMSTTNNEHLYFCLI